MNGYINPHSLFVGCMVPNWLCARTEIAHATKLVYARLSQHARADGSAWPAITTLAAEVALGTRQVERCLSELRSNGLIVAERRGLGQTNVYRFLWHSWMGEDPRPVNADTSDSSPMTRHESSPASDPLMKDPSEGSKRSNIRSRIPKDFSLSQGMAVYATRQGIPDPAAEFESFREYYEAKGTVWLDWIKVWQQWCRRAAQRKREQPYAHRNGFRGSGEEYPEVVPPPFLEK